MADSSKCNVCGLPFDGPDKMHIVIDNGVVMRHTYAHRRHRYVKVEVPGAPVQVQERSDLEVESLAHALRFGHLQEGWE